MRSVVVSMRLTPPAAYCAVWNSSYLDNVSRWSRFHDLAWRWGYVGSVFAVPRLGMRRHALARRCLTSDKRNHHCEKIMMIMNTNTSALATTP